MSGEIRGRVAEAISLLALEEEFGDALKVEAWDVPHEQLLWKPDILATIAGVRCLFLVTFSGSETHSKEKFWRNLAEATDAKMSLPGVLVVAVTFRARMRRKLALATEKLLDGYLECTAPELCEYSTAFIKLCRRLRPDQFLQRVRETIWEPAPSATRKELRRSIRAAVESRNSPVGLWRSLRALPRGSRIPEGPNNINLSRGVALLACALPSHQQEILEGRPLSGDIPAYYKRIDLVEGIADTVAGLVQETCRALGPQRALELAQSSITATGRASVQVLRSLPALEHQGGLVRAKFAELSTAEGLSNAFLACFSDPHVGLSETCGPELLGNVSGGWLYSYLKHLLAAAEARQGQEWIDEVSERSGVMRSILVGFEFPPFERGERLPSPEVLVALCGVFASRIAPLRSRLVSLHDSVVTELLSSTVANRLFSHGFKVLDTVIDEAVPGGVEYRLVPTAVSEYAGTDRKTGSTGCLAAGDAVIHTKTVTTSGRDHKIKELFGRSALMAVRHDAETGVWSVRGLGPAILVLDGQVGPGELRVLGQSWWNTVLYPADVDRGELAIALGRDGA